MNDSSKDLFANSPLRGGGEPERSSLKRTPSSLVSQYRNGSGDFLDMSIEDSGRVKKLKFDHANPYSSCCLSNSDINGGISSGSDLTNDRLHTADKESTLSYDYDKTDVENGKNESKDSFSFNQDTSTLKPMDLENKDVVDDDVTTSGEAVGRLSPTLRQSLDLNELNGQNDWDKREERTEELSPTLETSFDFIESPDSPDWLQDGYYERKIHEHASQREALDSSGAELSVFDKTVPYDADSLTQCDKDQVTVNARQHCENSDENANVYEREREVVLAADEVSQNDVTRCNDNVTHNNAVMTCNHADVATCNHAAVANEGSGDQLADRSVNVIKPCETSEGTVSNVIKTTDSNNKDNVVSITDESDEHPVKDIPATSPHPIPSTSPHQILSTGPHQILSTGPHQILSTGPHQIPSTGPHQIPSTSPLHNSTAAIDLTDSTPIMAGKDLPGSPSSDRIIVISDEGTPESVLNSPGHGNIEAYKNQRDIVALSFVNESSGSSRQHSRGLTADRAQPVVVSSGSSPHAGSPGHSTVPALIQKDSVEQDANTITNIIGEVDIEKVLKRLRQKRTDPHRVDVVLNEVLEGQIQSAINKTEAAVIEHEQWGTGGTDDPLMDDVQEVVRQVPEVDPNRVFYLLLESTSHPEDRVQTVVAQLRGHPAVLNTEDVILVTDHRAPMPPPLRSSLSDPTDPILVGDKLYSDMRTIAKIFPNKDRNEIYAYLEAHHDQSNRVQLVMDELLAMGVESQTPPFTQEVEVTDDQSMMDSATHAQTQSTNPQLDLERDVDHLCMVFPDCDPNYIYTRLEQTQDLPDRTQRLAAQMFEFKTYPKLKDVQEKNSKKALKRKLINMTLNMTEFLTMFPDPVDVFLDEDKAVSGNYKKHAVTELVNCFPMLTEPFIKKTLEKRKNHFTPALRELEKEAAKYTNRRKNSRKYLKQPRLIERDFPEQPDEFFFKELLFSRHEEGIKAHIEEQRRLRAARLEEAKRDGSLMECGCCFDDECIFEDMAACTDGHLFCKECIRRSSEVRIGENKFDFPCLMDSCDHKFPVHTLQSVLPHNVFSNVLRKMQEEEIRQADIPDLVSCPFCSFATIMPDPNDKVFKCLNPECLKESCRLCKEPNHIPLRCEEVEKGKETSMRTFIENRITEAMLRTCGKCKKKFFKLDGCNKMTCTCGATMCYVCRAPDIDYSHFNGQNGCAAHTDMNELHRQEMEKAAMEAKTKYQQENPEASGFQLKNDPMKLIEEMRQEREREQAQRVWNPFGIGFNPPGIPGVMFPPNWLADADDSGEDYSDDEDWSDEERSDQGQSSWEEREVTDESQDYVYLW